MRSLDTFLEGVGREVERLGLLWTYWQARLTLWPQRHKHPWYKDGKFPTFKNWCDHATPLCKQLGVAIMLGLPGFLYAVVYFIRH